MLVILVSLAAAMAFALAVVLQQHAAAAQPARYNLRPTLVLRLVQRPLWLAGIAASAVGTCLQLVALWHGSLVTVQPLLVCGLLFALPMNALWLRGKHPRALEILSAGTVCFGLVLLLIATDPRRGRGSGTALGWGVALGSLAAAVTVLVGLSIRARQPTWRAGLLAAAGGLINGLSAAFVTGVAREMGSSWHHGVPTVISATLSNWETYAFCASLILAVLLVQSAFQSGPIRWSLPALTAANPIASVILGATLLGERVRSGTFAIAGSVIGLGLVVAGILTLSSSALLAGEEGESSSRAPHGHSEGLIAIENDVAVGLTAVPGTALGTPL
ncbi:MAG: DMT family transporter [Acidimicrobiales bacterium]